MRALLLLMIAIAAAALAVPAAVAVVPVLTLPADITGEAAGPSGAVVSYAVASSDPTAPPSCNPSSGSVFPIGATPVTCSATNALGETASGGFNVTIADTTPPSIATPGDLTVEATGASGATATYSASASDAVSGSLTPVCAPTSGSTFSLGATVVTCSATDGAGKTGTATFTVNVVDSTPPVLLVPPDQGATTASAAGTAVTYPAATATDVVSGAVTPSCSPASGSMFPVGATVVACTAADARSNQSQGSFTVTVVLVDSTPPVVSVPPDQVAEATSGAGAAFSFDASATDNVDGSLPVSCSPSSGSTFPIGQTAVTCTATDKHGNTGTNSFSVKVTDTTAPTLSGLTDVTVEATSGSGAAATFSVSANDTVDGNVTPECSRASGSTFPLGSTNVSCSATDAHGNLAKGAFTVVVADTTRPNITVPAPMKLEADSASGATATFTVPASDAVDGGISSSGISCSQSTGSTFPLGTTTVTCNARDQAGNTATATFTIEVVDTTAPTLNKPAATSVTAGSNGTVSTTSGAVATFLAAAQASDRVDGTVAVQNDAPPTYGIGTHTVTFTAKDKAGNTSTKTSTVTVNAAPVANASGSTAPPPPQPPAPDTTPPAEVSRLAAKSLNRAVTLTWLRPPDADFDHVEVEQTAVGAPPVVLYRGAASSFTGRGLTNGTAYRFVVVTYDRLGNASLGATVLATPKESMLVRPADGTRVAAPALFVWKPLPETLYYNFQLFRVGATRVSSQATEVKVLSVWPLAPRYTLPKAWTYKGRRQRLTPGTYRWYIWPGVGAQSRGVYGPLVGASTFVVRR